MKTRMWIVETDQHGNMTDRKFSIDDPAYIPRIGEFVDGYAAGGWVDHVQWDIIDPWYTGNMNTVYVYLKEKKND